LYENESKRLAALHESYQQVETHKEVLDTQGLLRFGIVKIAAHESYQQVKSGF